MDLIRKKDYFLILIKEDSDFLDLIFSLKTAELNGNHLIINLLHCNLSHSFIIDSLLPFHFIWQKTNNSFILVSNIRKKLLKSLISISSLEEAIDFFHMEQLTKKLLK